MLVVWYKHVREYFPLQAQQFTKMILRTLELHRERNDYLQGQLDKVVGLALVSLQTGTPINAEELITVTGAPLV